MPIAFANSDTGAITVSQAAIDFVSILDANEAGSLADTDTSNNVITTQTMTTDDSDTYFAVGFDSFGNTVGDTTVTWSTAGRLDFYKVKTIEGDNVDVYLDNISIKQIDTPVP